MNRVKKILEELGMVFQSGYFKHPHCPWIVEFVAPPIAIGNEIVDTFASLETPLGSLHLLSAIDTVKDRLLAYFHWDDPQSLEQAISVCLEQEIDYKELQKWAAKQNQSSPFELFLKKLNRHPT